MIYPKKIQSKLGFEAVQEVLKKLCHGPGQDLVEELSFVTDQEELQHKLDQSREVIRLTHAEDAFPQGKYLNLSHNVQRLKTSGAYLEGLELRELADLLDFSSQWYRYFKKRKEEYPTLTMDAVQLQNFGELVRDINQIVDDAGNIKDNASPELLRIRNMLNDEQQVLRRALDKTMRWGLNEGYVPDDMTITVRNGRMVLPIRAEHKRQVKGFIHDESSTGQIVFLEPQHALESNNKIREFQFQEKREVIRILLQISGKISNYYQAILQANDYICKMDYLLAVAKMSDQLDAIIPELRPGQRQIQIIKGRHPGLFLSLQQQDRKVVPLSLELDQDRRILVISGPNAGGKSVALKTVGLLQFMVQCGLPVPVEEGSVFGVFEHILVDIGDEQSIESDLSTYSSHLKNMRQFTRIAGKDTLFLIDEFGSGTEPEMGGAIAAAILEDLHSSQALGVITTHYGILKNLAQEFKALVNGAMRFDADHLQPLFELEVGLPGSSYALEVASASRIDNRILDRAKTYVDPDKVKANELIVELERQRNSYLRNLNEVEQKQSQLDEELSKYRELSAELNEKKSQLIDDARKQAKELLDQANQKIEKTIREIRESQADKEKTKALRHELKQFERQHQPKKKKEKPRFVGGKISEGDFVVLDDGTSTGQVEEIKGNNAVVTFGAIRSQVKLNRLKKVGEPNQKSPKKASKGIDLARRRSEFKQEIDLRGQPPSEALEKAKRMIDEAMLVGADQIRILHGKGSGVLRDLIRNELKGYSQVKRFKDEESEKGGSGVTIVDFNY